LIVAAAICVPLLIIIKIPLLLFWEHTVMAFLVLSTSMSPAGWTTRILEWQPLRWIGRISYSLYLWQQVFMLWPSDRQPSPLQKMPLSILSLFACAAASYYILERPCIRLGHRLARPVSEARSRH
jgi:peptidoglycan/LPS O-acetylase OafA/YrhL